jgi:hypothetical protein
MDDLEKVLPSTVTNAAIRSGQELVIPFEETRCAIRVASEHLIAILGVEVFRVLHSGLGVQSYSGYDFSFAGDWPEYVRLNNEAAHDFIGKNRIDEGYRYILTATSEEEFNRLPAR